MPNSSPKSTCLWALVWTLNVKFLPKFILYLGPSLRLNSCFITIWVQLENEQNCGGGEGTRYPNSQEGLVEKEWVVRVPCNKTEYHHFTTKISIEQNYLDAI
jgi:hypothetical protein